MTRIINCKNVEGNWAMGIQALRAKEMRINDREDHQGSEMQVFMN